MKRKLFFSIGDQAVVSAFNFALNLFLIKLWSPEDFGVFALVAASAIFATMLQNAAVSTPLAVHLPAASDADARAVLRRVFSSANWALTGVVLLLSAAGFFAWLGDGQRELVLAASVYLASQFLREYQRGLLAVDGRLVALFVADSLYVVLATGGIAVLHFAAGGAWERVAVVLFLIAAAGVVSMAPQLLPRQRPSFAGLATQMRQVFGGQWHEIRWSLLGALTTDIQNRGYIFVAAAFFGPATVAHLQAGRIFFGPLGLITNAWSRVARPQLAAHLARGESAQFNATLWRALWAFVAFNLFFLLALWFAWPFLSNFVFSDKYQGLAGLVVAWGVVNLVSQTRACLSIGVQALRRFRELTLATIAGAMVSAVLLVAACLATESNWLIASVIGGECVALSIIVRVLRRPDVALKPAYAA